MGVASLRKAVFLDRDGVLVAPIILGRKPYSARSKDELRILPEAGRACASLRSLGFTLIVVTNQPDIARGKLALADAAEMNRKLMSALPLDDLRMCGHDDADGCVCRKPKPGLLLAAAAEFGIDLVLSYMVGDRWRDIGAGQAAGCRTILLDNGYDEPLTSEPDHRAANLAAAVDWIREREDGREG